MPDLPPINLGPYVLNAPSEAEKGHIRESLDLGSASLLEGRFLDSNRLIFTDPTNDQRTITLDKTLLAGAIADRLRTARSVSVTGHVSTVSPSPTFDGTENLFIPVTINPGVIDSDKLANNSVIADKIKNGEVTPEKLSAGAPTWTSSLINLPRGVELGSNITANENSYIDFHSSFPIVDYDARIWRRPGVNGALDILNVGNGNINIGGGLSVGSGNLVTSSRQLIGAIEITGNQINTTAASNVEIALNYENSDSTTNTFLNTTVFNGKRDVSARFFGDTKTLETYGPCRSITNGQIGWATAGLESRSTAGNAILALHAAGATATLLRHVRGRDGVEIRNHNDTSYSTLRAADIFSEDGNIFINNNAPTLYLQDKNHRSAMVHVNSNKFSVRRGKGTNSGEWEAINNRWPLEIDLENNNALFGGDVNAISFTSQSSIRYKERVSPLEYGLNTVKSLHGVSYHWKESGHKDIGLIAEDVQSVVPEVVQVSENGAEGIDYGKLTAILIEAIKELSGRVEELEKQLAQ